MVNIPATNQRTLNACRNCGWQWFSRSGHIVRRCPHCKTSFWNRDTRKRGKHSQPNIKSNVTQMKENGFTLEAIGQAIGISKQAVSLRLKKLDEIKIQVYWETEASRLAGCAQGTLRFFRLKGLISPVLRSGHWVYDNELISQAMSIIALHKNQYATLTCFQCGKQFQLPAHEYRARLKHRKNPNSFCSIRCWGQYLGQHWGFGIHPENRAYNLIGSE